MKQVLMVIVGAWLMVLLSGFAQAATGRVPACHPLLAGDQCTSEALWKTYVDAREALGVEAPIDIPGEMLSRSPASAPAGLPPGPTLAWRVIVGAVSPAAGASEASGLADPAERRALLALYASLAPDPVVAKPLAWVLADAEAAPMILPWLLEAGLPEARRQVFAAIVACDGEDAGQCLEGLPMRRVQGAEEILPVLADAGPEVRAALLASTVESDVPVVAPKVLEGLDDSGVETVWNSMEDADPALRRVLAVAVLQRMLGSFPGGTVDSPGEGDTVGEDPLTEPEHWAFVVLAESGDRAHAGLWRAMAAHAEPWIAVRGAIALESAGLGSEAAAVWSRVVGSDGQLPPEYFGAVGAPATAAANERFRARVAALQGDPGATCAMFENLPFWRSRAFAKEIVRAVDQAMRGLDPTELEENVEQWMPPGDEPTRLAFCLFDALAIAQPAKGPELEGLLAWMSASGAPLLRFFAATQRTFLGEAGDLALLFEAEPALRSALGADRIRRTAARVADAGLPDVDTAALGRLGCIGWFAEAVPRAGAVTVGELPRDGSGQVLRHVSLVEGREVATRCVVDGSGKVLHFESLLQGP